MELEDLAESLEARGSPDAERLRDFARQIRTDGCHIASPCEGCSGGYRLQDLLPEGKVGTTGSACSGDASVDGPKTNGPETMRACCSCGADRRVA